MAFYVFIGTHMKLEQRQPKCKMTWDFTDFWIVDSTMLHLIHRDRANGDCIDRPTKGNSSYLRSLCCQKTLINGSDLLRKQLKNAKETWNVSSMTIKSTKKQSSKDILDFHKVQIWKNLEIETSTMKIYFGPQSSKFVEITMNGYIVRWLQDQSVFWQWRKALKIRRRVD